MITSTVLPPAWTPLRYHAKQAAAFHCNKRFINLACGRRSGKTEIAKRKIAHALCIEKPWKPNYFYALPTINQAKRVAWNDFLDLIPEGWIDDVHVMDLRIKTLFGSTLYLYGLDQPQRLEGIGYDGGVIDESSDIKPGVFNRSIRPALSDRRGWCWRIGVPKRYGIGAAEYKEWFDKGFNPQFPDIVSFNWPSSDIVDEKEIEDARNTLDGRDFREQYEASWELAGGLIFHSFSKECIRPCSYDPSKRIIVGVDFNVNPFTAVVGHIYGEDGVKITRIFDEFYIRNTNTGEFLNEFNNRYGSHTAGVTFYPDASSAARHTSTALSDVVQIRNDSRIRGLKIYHPKKNPPILDRFAATNAAFTTASGVHRVFVDPSCKNTIRDLNNRAYKEGTRVPDDTDPDAGHITDALGYMLIHEYPIRIESRKTPQYSAVSF